MSNTIEKHRSKSMQWNEAFESKGLKVKIEKTKVIVIDGITKDGLPKSKAGSCGM